MKLLAIVLAFGCGARKPHCLAPRDANELQGNAMRADEQRYNQALASRHLTPVNLPIRRFELPRDNRPMTAIDTVEERELGPIGSPKVRVIMAGENVANCNSGPYPNFVRDGTKVFRVARLPRVVKTTKIVVCAECVPGPSFACGGAQMLPEAVGFELPNGMTYEGAIEIRFDSETVEATTDAKKPCPEQPSPP